ncbi:hypothetical protein Syun_003500 [Stephania yunnanensis]|uniref:Uncharacterized protein n=1 Tax=Stephania yunnanensis TaxID=152371 RepID=A0AAP0L1A5_9MAGN
MRGAYDANACVRYGALMHELCALAIKLNLVTNEAWNRYCDYWASTYFKARSKKASLNRKSEKDGPSTGHSKHTGSSRCFRTHKEILALDNDDLTPNDVFFHVYTKDHDGVTFIDNRLARFHAELVRRQPFGNAHGLRSEYLLGTTITTTITSGASPAGWDGSGSFTGAEYDDDVQDIQE